MRDEKLGGGRAEQPAPNRLDPRHALSTCQKMSIQLFGLAAIRLSARPDRRPTSAYDRMSNGLWPGVPTCPLSVRYFVSAAASLRRTDTKVCDRFCVNYVVRHRSKTPRPSPFLECRLDAPPADPSPYAPELNPIENVWEYLRGNKLAITVFDDYDDIVDKTCDAWNFFEQDPMRIASITTRTWATVND